MTIRIRSGGHASSQRRHRTGVEAALSGIRSTTTGRIVLRRLTAAPFDVIIEPNLVPGPDGDNNAFAEPASEVHSGNTRLGQSARGSRAIVSFSARRIRGKGAGQLPHELLLHELCHCLRIVYGRERLKRINGANELHPMSGGFDTVEEFFAVMVTSVHSSELGRKARGDHGTWALPSVDLLRKRPFDTRLREFKVSMPDLCRELRSIPPTVASFNPFRDIK